MFAQTQMVARKACEQGSIQGVVTVVRVGLSLVGQVGVLRGFSR